MLRLPKVNKGTAWDIKTTDTEIIEHLKGTYPMAFAKVMCNRGLYEVSSVERFLNCSLCNLPAKKLADKALKAAALRVLSAIERKEKVLVYGDYDVDGVTSTALVTDIIRQLGGCADFFIPNRLEDGYGLTMKRSDELADKGYGLVITVDCGINAVDEVRRLRQRGVDTIITDHHEPKIDSQADLFIAQGVNSYILPEAYSVINPKIEEPGENKDAPGYCNLAGVGVAFMLCWSLIDQAKKKNLPSVAGFKLDKYLDLVALGTIADVVPIRGQNRIMVKHGLAALNRTSRPGLRQLIDKAGITDCSVRDVTYHLAPRINAPGRVSDAKISVELMLTSDRANGEVILDEIEDANKERQRIEKETFREAQEAFESTLPIKLPQSGKIPGGLMTLLPNGPGAIVVAGDYWNPGVIGIVASRMVERYGIPSVVIAMNGDVGKGSCRSCGTFHMFEALRRSCDLLESYGGHRHAAGLSVKRENIGALRDALCSLAKEGAEEEEIHSLPIDAETSLSELDDRLVSLVSQCEPHGAGNPYPYFLVRHVRLDGEPKIINSKHLKFTARQNGTCRTVMGFNLSERLKELEASPEFDMVVYPYMNVYRNTSQVELQLVDMKPCESQR